MMEGENMRRGPCILKYETWSVAISAGASKAERCLVFVKKHEGRLARAWGMARARSACEASCIEVI